MLIAREGSLLLAASGSLRIVCEPIAINLAWNLILGINHQTLGRVVRLGRGRPTPVLQYFLMADVRNGMLDVEVREWNHPALQVVENTG
jgi:hypothetical protein